MITMGKLIEIVREPNGNTAGWAEASIKDAILTLNAADDGMPTLSETGPWDDEDADIICEEIVDPASDRRERDPEMIKIEMEEAEVATMDQAAENASHLRSQAETYWRADQWRTGAMADLQAAIRDAVPTMSESEIARVTGVTRMTVRKALGK